MMSGPAVETEAQLEDLLSEPTEEVIETLGRIPGDLILLGVSGKMGPSLARMARRASDAAGVRRRIIGVSRFSMGGAEALQADGIEAVSCDLLDDAAVSRLPDADLVIYLVGRKFGSTGDEPLTWAINAHVPGPVCRRYRGSRIVAFSSGNIYGLVPATGAGSREEDTPRPVGEYAMSCLARERLFEYFSREFRTPTALIRLNYACDLRYGVLVDLAQRVRDGAAIDLSMGYLNTIWQGDANAMTLRSLEHASTPARVINVTGPERLSVRDVSERLGRLMDRPVRFVGTEADTALLSDARRALELLGPLRVSTDTLIEWVARWVSKGGRSLGKPTHFESRDGSF